MFKQFIKLLAFLICSEGILLAADQPPSNQQPSFQYHSFNDSSTTPTPVYNNPYQPQPNPGFFETFFRMFGVSNSGNDQQFRKDTADLTGKVVQAPLALTDTNNKYAGRDFADGIYNSMKNLQGSIDQWGQKMTPDNVRNGECGPVPQAMQTMLEHMAHDMKQEADKSANFNASKPTSSK